MVIGDMVLLAKLVLGIAAAVLALIIVPRRVLYRLSQRQFSLAALTFLVLSRCAVFATIFLVAGLPAQSDVAGYYYLQAKAILSGLIPYQDFSSSYAPLFPYIASLPVRLWDSPKALILLAILFECLSFPFWLKVTRLAFTEDVARRATLIYLTASLPLVNVAINGQNQIWIGFFLVLSIYLLLLRKDFCSGVIFGISLISVKFLSMLFASVLTLAAARRVRWLVGFAVLPLVIYGFMAANGIDVLVPVRAEALAWSSGNFPFLLTALGLRVDSALAGHSLNAILLISLAAVFLKAVNKNLGHDRGQVIHLVTLIMLTFMMVSKKAYTNYLTMFFFPLCVTVGSKAVTTPSLVVFGLFGTVATIEPSLWFRWMQQHDFRLLWESLLAPGVTQFQMIVFLLCEITLLSCYTWYFVQTWEFLSGPPQVATYPEPISVRV